MDIYRIAVGIHLASNHVGVLGGMAQMFTGLNKQADEFHEKFNRGKLALAGIASIGLGAGLLVGLEKVANHGDKLLDQQNKLIRAGRTHAEVAELTAKAYGEIARQVPTATGADALRVAGQLNVVKGDFQSAVAATAQSLKIESLLANVTGKSAEGAGHALWRSLEMKGLTAGSDEHKAIGEKLMETFVQNIAASGGKLTASDYQGMAKRGASAWAKATPEFLAGPMSVVAADLGGDTAGTALSTAYNFMTSATQMSKQQFAALKKIDMIDMSHVKMGKGGSFLAEPGAIRGGLEYQGDLYNWVQKELIPHMDKAGIHEGAQRDGLMAQIGRNKNTQRMFNMFADPEFVSQIEKDIKIFRQSQGLDKAYQNYIENDPKGVKEAYRAQEESMWEAIGAPLMKAAMPVMREITGVFSSIGELANAHPEVVKAIGQGIAVLGASLVGAGAAALLAAIGPVGWFVGGIVGTVGAFAAIDSTGFKATLQAIRDGALYAYHAVTDFKLDPAVAHKLSMFLALAKSEALIIYDTLKGFVLDPANIKAIATTWENTKKEFEGLKTGFETVRPYLEKALDWFKTLLSWRQAAQDTIMGYFKELSGATTVAHLGMSESAREGLAARDAGKNVDPMGELATKFINLFKNIGSALDGWITGMAKEVDSWPERLRASIAEFGSNLVTAIGDMLRSLVKKLNPFISFEGGGSDGAKLQNASFETGGANDNFRTAGSLARGSFGGKALPVGAGSGPGHVASKEERAAYIRASALAHGIDPEVALRVAQSEGFNKYTGDFGTSFGDFQLHFGGSGIRGMNSGGLGDVLARRGINARDPNTWKQQTDFAMEQAAKGGWSPWHGARKVGIGDFQGIGTRRASPTASAPPKRSGQPVQIHVHSHLDGRQVGHSVVDHVMRESTFPTSTGGPDDHGSWFHPGRTMNDAA